MKFKYTGEIKDLTMFGYDFSSGECEVEDLHFINKLKNIKEFEEAKNYLNTVAEKRTSSVSPHNATMKNYPSPEPISLALKTEIEKYY